MPNCFQLAVFSPVEFSLPHMLFFIDSARILLASLFLNISSLNLFPVIFWYCLNSCKRSIITACRSGNDLPEVFGYHVCSIASCLPITCSFTLSNMSSYILPTASVSLSALPASYPCLIKSARTMFLKSSNLSIEFDTASIDKRDSPFAFL